MCSLVRTAVKLTERFEPKNSNTSARQEVIRVRATFRPKTNYYRWDFAITVRATIVSNHPNHCRWGYILKPGASTLCKNFSVRVSSYVPANGSTRDRKKTIIVGEPLQYIPGIYIIYTEYTERKCSSIFATREAQQASVVSSRYHPARSWFQLIGCSSREGPPVPPPPAHPSHFPSTRCS